MKRLVALLSLAAAATACGEDSDVFYSVTYSVVRVEAAVTLAGTGEGETAEDPDDARIEALEAEVLAEAPVAAGGSYRLDFTVFNGGALTVVPAPETAPVTGEFFKEPGTTQLQLAFDQQRYTGDLNSYYTEDHDRCVLLLVDLTERYQALYPDAGITFVQRREYTSTPVH